MKFWKELTVWLEQEFIIVDKNLTPVNEIQNEIASKVVLELIQQQYPELVKDKQIKPELDACQMEINTLPWKPDEVKSELVDLYRIVENTAQKLWYNLIGWVPNQKFDPICSCAKPHYKDIHEKLLSVWLEYRKATNIAGIHLHIEETPEKWSRFIYLSNKIRKAIEQDNLKQVFMSNERFERMKMVIQWLLKVGIFLDKKNPFTNTIVPYWFTSKEEVEKLVFDPFNKWGIVSNYNLVWLKKPNGKYTVEVRTPDSKVFEDDNELKNYIDKIFNTFLE